VSDVNANIGVNIDSSQALDELKRLQRQISEFNLAIAKSNEAAALAQKSLQRNLINSINAIGSFSAELRTVNTTAESFTKALEGNKLSMREYFRYAAASTKTFGGQFRSELDTLNKVAVERVKTLQTQYIKLGRDANGAMKAIAVRPLVLDMTDLATQTQIAAQKQALFNQLMRQGSTQLLNFGKNTQWAGRQLMVGFTLPLMAFGAAASKAFRDLETEVIKFRKVYGDLGTDPVQTEKALEGIKALADGYTKYGVEVSKTVGLASQAAAAGFKNADLLAQTEAATKLAILGQIEQQQALETTISLQNAFKISSTELATTIDFLNAVENQTVTSLDDITTAIPKVAPVIQSLGGDVKDLAFFLTAMKEGGINASEGANALKSGLASLINPTNKATAMLGSMGINIDAIVTKNAGNLKKTVIEFAQQLDKLDPLSRARAIETMFGKFQFARISTLLSNVIQQGNQASRVLDLAGQSASNLATLTAKELGVTSESALIKFEAAVARLKASLAPVGEVFMNSVAPILEFVSKVLDKFNGLSEGTKKFIAITVGVIGGLGPVFLMTFGLLANGIANILKLFVTLRTGYQKLTGQSQNLGEQTQYMTNEQLEAAAAAHSLEQSHARLTQQFSVEATAVNQLRVAYEQALVAGAKFATMNPGMMKTPKLPGFANGSDGVIIRGPGTGTSDSILARVSNGEAIIPALQVARHPDVVRALVSGQLPKFGSGDEEVNTSKFEDNVVEKAKWRKEPTGNVKAQPVARGYELSHFGGPIHMTASQLLDHMATIESQLGKELPPNIKTAVDQLIKNANGGLITLLDNRVNVASREFNQLIGETGTDKVAPLRLFQADAVERGDAFNSPLIERMRTGGASEEEISVARQKLKESMTEGISNFLLESTDEKNLERVMKAPIANVRKALETLAEQAGVDLSVALTKEEQALFDQGKLTARKKNEILEARSLEKIGITLTEEEQQLKKRDQKALIETKMRKKLLEETVMTAEDMEDIVTKSTERAIKGNARMEAAYEEQKQIGVLPEGKGTGGRKALPGSYADGRRKDRVNADVQSVIPGYYPVKQSFNWTPEAAKAAGLKSIAELDALYDKLSKTTRIKLDQYAGDVHELARQVVIEAEKAGIRVGEAAVTGVAKGAKTKSPSEATRQTARDIIAGLRNELAALEGSVRASGTRVGQIAVQSIDTAIVKESAKKPRRVATREQGPAQIGVLPNENSIMLPIVAGLTAEERRREERRKKLNELKEKSKPGLSSGGMMAGMGIMAGSMAMSALPDFTGKAMVTSSLNMAAMGAMFGPWGAAAGAAVGLVTAAIGDLLEKERQQKAMQEAVFQASADLATYFGNVAATVDITLANLNATSLSTKNGVMELGKSFGYSTQELAAFKQMLESLPEGNPLKDLITGLTNEKDPEKIKEIAQAFVTTQVALGQIKPDQAQKTLDLILSSSGHLAMVGSTFISFKNQTDAVTKSLKNAAGNSVALGESLTQIMSVAYQASSLTELEGVINGIAAAGLNAAEALSAMYYAYLSVGNKEMAAAAKVLMSIPGMTSSGGAYILQAWQRGLRQDITKKTTAQQLIEEATKYLADNPDKFQKKETQTTSALTKEQTKQLETTTKAIDALKKKKAELDKILKIERAITEQNKKQNDFSQKQADLDQKIAEAKMSGNYIEAANLEQQKLANIAEFNNDARLAKLEAQANKLQEQIDKLEEVKSAINDSATKISDAVGDGADKIVDNLPPVFGGPNDLRSLGTFANPQPVSTNPAVIKAYVEKNKPTAGYITGDNGVPVPAGPVSASEIDPSKAWNESFIEKITRLKNPTLKTEMDILEEYVRSQIEFQKDEKFLIVDLKGKDGLTYTFKVLKKQGKDDFIRMGEPVKKADGGYIRHYEPGGSVNGPGTGTSDSIPAMLSNGEYVIRASAVKQYGTGFLNNVNTQKFATGGLVQRFGSGTTEPIDSKSWWDKLGDKMSQNGQLGAVSFGIMDTIKSIGKFILANGTKNSGLFQASEKDISTTAEMFMVGQIARLFGNERFENPYAAAGPGFAKGMDIASVLTAFFPIRGGAGIAGSAATKTTLSATEKAMPAALRRFFKDSPYEAVIKREKDIQEVVSAVKNTNAPTIPRNVKVNKNRSLDKGSGFYNVADESMNVGKKTTPFTVAHEAFHHVDYTSSFESYKKMSRYIAQEKGIDEAVRFASAMNEFFQAKSPSLYYEIEQYLQKEQPSMFPYFRGILEGTADGNIYRIPKSTRNELNILDPFRNNAIYNQSTLRQLMDASTKLGPGYEYMMDPEFIKGYLTSAYESAGAAVPFAVKQKAKDWVTILDRYGINQNTSRVSNEYFDFYDYLVRNNLAKGGMVSKFHKGGPVGHSHGANGVVVPPSMSALDPKKKFKTVKPETPSFWSTITTGANWKSLLGGQNQGTGPIFEGTKKGLLSLLMGPNAYNRENQGLLPGAGEYIYGLVNVLTGGLRGAAASALGRTGVETLGTQFGIPGLGSLLPTGSFKYIGAALPKLVQNLGVSAMLGFSKPFSSGVGVSSGLKPKPGISAPKVAGAFTKAEQQQAIFQKEMVDLDGYSYPIYTVGGDKSRISFKGHTEDVSATAEVGAHAVPTTPIGLLEEALRLNPNNAYAKRMLENFKNKTFGPEEEEFAVRMASAVGMDDTGAKLNKENTDGFAEMLAYLNGNIEAQINIVKRRNAFVAMIEKNKAERIAAAKAPSSFLEGVEPINTSQAPIFHATPHPVVRNADGSVDIYPHGYHTMGKFDEEGLPAGHSRSTVHTTAESVVAGHIERTGGTNYSEIGMDLETLIKSNGLPYNADTIDMYWALGPGKALHFPNPPVIRPSFYDEASYTAELIRKGLIKPGEKPSLVTVDPKTKDIYRLLKSEYTDEDRAALVMRNNPDAPEGWTPSQPWLDGMAGREEKEVLEWSRQELKKMLGIDTPYIGQGQHSLDNFDLNNSYLKWAENNGIMVEKHNGSDISIMESDLNSHRLLEQIGVSTSSKAWVDSLEAVKMAVLHGDFKTNIKDLNSLEAMQERAIASGVRVTFEDAPSTLPSVKGTVLKESSEVERVISSIMEYYGISRTPQLFREEMPPLTGGFYRGGSDHSIHLPDEVGAKAVAHEAVHAADSAGGFWSLRDMIDKLILDGKGQMVDKFIIDNYELWASKSPSLYARFKDFLYGTPDYPYFRGLLEKNANGKIPKDITIPGIDLGDASANLYGKTLSRLLMKSMQDGHGYFRDPGFVEALISDTTLAPALLSKGRSWIEAMKRYNVTQDTSIDSKEFKDLLEYAKVANLSTGGMVPKFHSWNGPIPGPYGQELSAVLKSGTEGVYQEDYMNRLRRDADINSSTSNSNTVYNIDMVVNGGNTSANDIANQVMAKLKLVASQNNQTNKVVI